MKIATIERHPRGVRIVVEHEPRADALPKRDAIVVSMPEYAEVTGYGRSGARAIKQAAADYLERWEALSAEDRNAVLLTERRRAIDRADADMLAVAAFVAEKGEDHGDLWVATERDQKAHDRWTAAIQQSDLLFGESFRMRQQRDEDVAETLRENGKEIPPDLALRLRLSIEPLVDPSDYPLD